MDASQTQKTVCKHLLEDPYVYQVVDDPLNALKVRLIKELVIHVSDSFQRVQNNRRVNQQKKEAIEEGRKRLGVRGRGKGVSLEPTSAFEGQSEADEDESPLKEEFSSPEPEYIPPSKASRPPRAATKRSYAPVSDEADDEDGAEVSSPPKRAKRHSHKRLQSTAGAQSSNAQHSENVAYGSSEDFGSLPPSRMTTYTPTDTYQGSGSYYDHSYSDARGGHPFPSHNGSTYQFNGLADHGYGDIRSMHHGYASSPLITSNFGQPYHSRHCSSGSLSEISPLDNGDGSEHF